MDNYISLIYSKLESLNNRKCLSNNNCFKKSINEFIIWHQKLEMRMFPNNKYPDDIPIRQVTKALLFTSVVGREHMADLNFMSTLFSGNEFKPILPVLIFSYICNYTESDYKKLHNIINKKSKDTLLQKKTPHYLNITESSCKSMNEQYSERLIKNIKYGFIHIVSFLKILNLPICKESEKLHCLNWYMDTFSENAHTFFSLDEFNRIKAVLEEYGQNKIKHMNDADYLERVQFIDRIIDNIEKIDDFDMTKKYVNKIQKYISEKKSIKIEKTIEERNMNFFLVPVSFTQRYDYYYGKFLYKLMYKSERQCDLLNIFIDTNKLHAQNLFVYCRSSDKEPAFSLYDVDFSLTSVNMMKEKENISLGMHFLSF